MLINSVQKMLSIQCRISIEFRDLSHQLSANIFGSFMWRYSVELAFKPTTNQIICVSLTGNFTSLTF